MVAISSGSSINLIVLNLKFMSYNLYPLPPSLKPCKPVDIIDCRYLNQTHSPLFNPLKKASNIEFHNEKWFSKLIKLLFYQFLITMILSNSLINRFFHYLLYLNYIKESTQTLHNHGLKQKNPPFPLLLLLLFYIIPSPILIVFSLYSILP